MDLSPLTILAAGLLAFTAVLHSVLGELAVLRPLFADARWTLKDLPRAPAEVLLRFAWHLTTLAWVGSCLTLIGVPAPMSFALVCLLSSAVIFVTLRGHLAWPLFLVAGLAALLAAELLPSVVLVSIGGGAALIAVLAAGLHIYWGLIGKRGLSHAIPTRADGSPAFEPGPLACVAVAVALLVFAALVLAGLMGVEVIWVRALLVAAALVLGIRALGDAKTVGFSKREHSSAFARADDAIFTPLVVALALGALAPLAL